MKDISPRAITVRPQWAYAILDLDKGIENRQQKDGRVPAIVKHRGPLFIHAGADCGTRKQFLADVQAIEKHAGRARYDLLSPGGRPRSDLRRGGIVGLANAVGTVHPDGKVEGCDPALADLRWHIPGHWGLMLVDRRRVLFTPMKGGLGLWRLPDWYDPGPPMRGWLAAGAGNGLEGMGDETR